MMWKKLKNMLCDADFWCNFGVLYLVYLILCMIIDTLTNSHTMNVGTFVFGAFWLTIIEYFKFKGRY